MTCRNTCSTSQLIAVLIPKKISVSPETLRATGYVNEDWGGTAEVERLLNSKNRLPFVLSSSSFAHHFPWRLMILGTLPDFSKQQGRACILKQQKSQSSYFLLLYSSMHPLSFWILMAEWRISDQNPRNDLHERTCFSVWRHKAAITETSTIRSTRNGKG